MHPVVQSLLWIAASLVVLAVIIVPVAWHYPAALDRLTPEDMDDEMGAAAAPKPADVTVRIPAASLIAR